MEVFLVGGAVRDELLGKTVVEKDWVVVGATPQEMIKQGYIQVGKDFPVFLHPSTKEEYALARTERKTGRGYTGFHVYTSPEVTLEEDLARRDLTINAIAKDKKGKLIDPFGGSEDIEKRVLRHVSPAFVEDPLRVLRVARFATRFNELGFKIAPKTMKLMQEIVSAGEMEHLVADRVWSEMDKAFSEKDTWVFFDVLKKTHAMDVLFPMLLEDRKAYKQAYSNLKEACEKQASKVIKLAVFLYPFAQASGDDKFITAFCEKYRVSNEYRTAASLIARANGDFKKVLDTHGAKAMLSFLEKMDVFRRPAHLVLFLQAALILDGERTSQVKDLVMQCAIQAKNIDIQETVATSLVGAAIQEIVRNKRLAAIENFLASKKHG